ncbi:MAG TPA: ABC transporter ATP-binding protein [Pseudolabrys sp.]|nr:ABC transporter ATP-binding protein [Pseudolabrys sp.]
MTYVRLSKANVEIPVYDSHSLRLIKLPSFRRSKVGTQTITRAGGVMRMHALKDLDLDLAEGDRVCIIGHNGAGKTTLLRLIAQIYSATSGVVDISGRVFALLGASLTLNPDATGYENISLVAAIQDWPAECVPDYVRNIEEFTELGEYLSLPTRVYSAGMLMRLAVALATLRAPDILLIDEGIGAGDADFQRKMQARVQQFVGRAKILLLASHSRELCRALCNKALLLSKGRAVYFGGVEEGFAEYGKLSH